MKIVNYDQISIEEWDRLVQESPDGWLYQSHGFIDWSCRNCKEQFSFAVTTDTDELVAICPLFFDVNIDYSNQPLYRFFQRSLNYILRKVLRGPGLGEKVLSMSYGGPAIKKTLGQKGRKKLLRFIYSHIDNVATNKRADKLIVRLNDLAPINLPPLRIGYNPLWLHGLIDPVSYPPRLFNLIDLSKDISTIRSEMDQDCRNEVNKGEKMGVTLREGNVTDLPLFHEIHKDSWDRTMGHHQQFEHFESMFQYLEEEKHCKLYFAEVEGKAIAAVLIHTFKNCCFYWAGCSLVEGRKYKANNFLLYSSMLHLKENGYQWFGVGLFQSYMGKNKKEYTVGQYKAQFCTNHLLAFEGMKKYR